MRKFCFTCGTQFESESTSVEKNCSPMCRALLYRNVSGHVFDKESQTLIGRVTSIADVNSPTGVIQFISTIPGVNYPSGNSSQEALIKFEDELLKGTVNNG